jgi:Xaa-Pro aminopeptidase
MGFSVEELRARRERLCAAMTRRYPDWGAAFFTEPVNQYYLTGTIQDGIVLVLRERAAAGGGRLIFGVRRSYVRAREESPLFRPVCGAAAAPAAETLLPIKTYRELAEETGGGIGPAYIEGDTLPAAALERLKKYFPASFTAPRFLDGVIRGVRAVKSAAEISRMRRSGAAHRILLEERVPALLREGMSEAEFAGALQAEMSALGYQGITRFHQSRTEMGLGQLGFGTNALSPSFFDGPGGARGNGAAAPVSGDASRRLAKGDAVFVDIGFGIGGYHTDKTQVYFFGTPPPAGFVRAHRFCMEIQKRLAGSLVPGGKPSRIYEECMGALDSGGREWFMGVDGAHQVRFLGHGVGLVIDELPVIAAGFDEPLEENMTLALEPKKAVPGIGLAGVEDTYLVRAAGPAECLTGGGREPIVV